MTKTTHLLAVIHQLLADDITSAKEFVGQHLQQAVDDHPHTPELKSLRSAVVEEIGDGYWDLTIAYDTDYEAPIIAITKDAETEPTYWVSIGRQATIVIDGPDYDAEEFTGFRAAILWLKDLLLTEN